jgi:hypothetical protein
MRTAAWNILAFVCMWIIILSALALMASENIDGAGTWLASTETLLAGETPLLSLIIVAGVVAALMGGRKH